MTSSLPSHVLLRINNIWTEGLSPLIERMIIHREVCAWTRFTCWAFTGSLPTNDRSRHYVSVEGTVHVFGGGPISMSLRKSRRNRVLPLGLRLLPAEESEFFRAAVRQVVIAPRFDAPRRTNGTLVTTEWVLPATSWEDVDAE